jgi:3',5'-cyclic AMP phosphodiesterase CpdA
LKKRFRKKSEKLYTFSMMKVKTDSEPSVRAAAAVGTHPSTSGESFSLAHLSDLHLTTLRGTKITQLLNKRLLGYFSWRRKRRVVHSRAIVEALLEDLRLIRPDHVAVTGDLTHLGLPEEFAEAGRWLLALGNPERVTVIPGNHEAYTGRAWARSCAMWTPYLVSDNHGAAGEKDLFPSLRIRGRVALIGLSSASPSAPFFAIGRLGEKQLARLGELLKQTRGKELLRIILIHHPPVPGTTTWRKRLVDSEALHAILARHGAELILHGHTHTPAHSEVRIPTGSITVIGAPSSSELNPWSGRCAQYNVYRIRQVGPTWEIIKFIRSYSPTQDCFVPERESILSIPYAD